MSMPSITGITRYTAVIATITVGSGAQGVAVSPTGPYAGDIYVTNAGDNTLSVIS
jgi:DNA-binding beta-propeller fold protein YncE